MPAVAHGVRCVSMGFFVDEDRAVAWRGPMLHKALEQFITEVHWGAPEFLLIDMPPGTGDVALSVAQHLPAAELYVVTTPQPAAERVAQRAGALARELRLSVRGVIENMSWFTGPDGARLELFGAGGGATLAASSASSCSPRSPSTPRCGRARTRDAPRVVDAESDVARTFDALAAPRRRPRPVSDLPPRAQHHLSPPQPGDLAVGDRRRRRDPQPVPDAAPRRLEPWDR